MMHTSVPMRQGMRRQEAQISLASLACGLHLECIWTQ